MDFGYLTLSASKVVFVCAECTFFRFGKGPLKSDGMLCYYASRSVQEHCLRTHVGNVGQNVGPLNVGYWMTSVATSSVVAAMVVNAR
jgi:hypothetical protein